MARKTYKATADGFLSVESRFVKEGEVFSVEIDEDAEVPFKPGSWMEDVTPAAIKKQAKAEDKIFEAEKDKPDGSGPSADTMKLKN